MQRKWRVLLVTAVAVFMSFLDVTIVNIAFPDIRTSFPASSLGVLSWIINAYSIVFAAALVPAGRLADRLGRRRFFFAGALLLGAGVGALALAIVQGPQWHWGSGRIVGAFAASALLLSAFVMRSARHPAPVVEL